MLKINSSSFGNVYKVYEKDSNPYIIKNVPFYNGIVPNLLEIILYFTQCHNLMQAYDYKICNSYYSLSMPIANCDLSKIYTRKIKFDIRSIFRDICLGIKYLHDRRIIHGDIKPENILIFKNRNKAMAKVSDFSLSSFCFGEYIENKNAYTIGYRAPEIYNSGYYSFKSDIWALGQTLKTLRLEESPSLKELLHYMTLENINERWSIDEVLQSEYLKSFETPRQSSGTSGAGKISQNDILNLIQNSLIYTSNDILLKTSNDILSKMCRKINYTDLYQSKQEITYFDSLFKNFLNIL